MPSLGSSPTGGSSFFVALSPFFSSSAVKPSGRISLTASGETGDLGYSTVNFRTVVMHVQYKNKLLVDHSLAHTTCYSISIGDHII